MIEINVFIDENDLYKSQPLHEYILRYLLHNHIDGATLIEGKMGFGHRRHLNNPKLFGGVDDKPLMIISIDEEDKLTPLLPHIKEIVKEGLIIKKNVEKY